MGNKGTKAQSAMEYLMTYGWAILIIAVVLAVLFSLNVFNAGANLGSSCIGQPGYSCSAASINSGGILTFTLGQGTGSTVYNAVFSCISSANSVAVPGTATQPFNAIGTATSAGTINPVQQTSSVTVAASNSISNSASITISGLQCYPATGATGAPGATGFLYPIGTGFTGTIWMGYASSLGGSPQFAKIATVSVKSTS
jgi:hypothetical protein